MHKVMGTANTYVRACIDEDTTARATDALEAMGLSVSDAIRLLVLQVADEAGWQINRFCIGAPSVSVGVPHMATHVAIRYNCFVNVRTEIANVRHIYSSFSRAGHSVQG